MRKQFRVYFYIYIYIYHHAGEFSWHQSLGEILREVGRSGLEELAASRLHPTSYFLNS